MNDTVLINIFIIISIILTAGYFFGRRRNRAVAAGAINTLINLMKPAEQKITNIGGLVGYHVEMHFHGRGNVEMAHGTMTLLPRHSLLYLPVSRIFRKFDRFFITFTLREPPTGKEAHIYEKRFHNRYRKNEGKRFRRKEAGLGSGEFIFLFESGEDLDYLEKLAAGLEDTDRLKEVSIHPDLNVIELLIVPTSGENRLLESILHRSF